MARSFDKIMTDSDFKYMTEALAADMAELLSNDFGMGITEALDTLYNSETYAKLTDRNTGLYFQSAGYLFSFLRNELEKGKLA